MLAVFGERLELPVVRASFEAFAQELMGLDQVRGLSAALRKDDWERFAENDFRLRNRDSIYRLNALHSGTAILRRGSLILGEPDFEPSCLFNRATLLPTSRVRPAS